MKNANVFNKYILYNEDSPTKFVMRKDGRPAGYKSKNRQVLVIWFKGKCYMWSIPRVLFEIYHGFEPPQGLNVLFRDGDRTNLSKQNLMLTTSKR